MQDISSIEGQIALGHKIAKQADLEVIGTYEDAAKSGQSIAGRDAYAAMCEGARRHQFEVIIAEHLDRLSRDRVDLPQLAKLLEFNKIEIRDQHKFITPVDIAVQVLINSMDKGVRADKVRRGHDLAVSKGLCPGAVTYGYSAVPGQPGERVINENEAKIVRRIFTEYAQERSPMKIAHDLTRDGVPTPGSTRNKKHKGLTVWNGQGFVGGRHHLGMISNRIYIGERVWNSHSTDEHPDTRKKVKVPNPEHQHLIVKVPDLRIIDQALWDRAQAVRAGRSVKKFGPGGKVKCRPVVARNEHLLSGLLVCGECGGHMRIAQTSRNGGPRAACAAAHQHGTCSHAKTYDFNELKSGVIEKMPEFLASDEAIKAAEQAYREEKKKGQANDSQRLALERKQNAITLQIETLVELSTSTARPVKEIGRKIDALELERSSIDEQLSHLGPGSNVVTLHPKFMDVYRTKVMSVHDAITARPDAPESRILFRSLIEKIVVHPTRKRMPYEFTPWARISALQGADPLSSRRTMEEVYAAQGLTYADKDKQGKAGLAISEYRNDVISLGRWLAAA